MDSNTDITDFRAGAGGLCLKPVMCIKGRFRVPSYQRGYRWGTQEVGQLVGDIRASMGRNYCLQPIVVKDNGDEWELVDGQQRLTTLYLLVRALGGEPRWTLRYDTRPGSADFLAQPDAARADTNIDFHHIWQARQAIESEMDALDSETRAKMLDSLSNHVRVIWYEAPAQVGSIDLFTRLNSGRIPLNDAELFKALLLSRVLAGKGCKANGAESSRQLRANELAVQWDVIERDLRRPELWAFLAGDRTCATHISLLFEIISKVKPSDAVGTFKIFDELSKKVDNVGSTAAWREVVQLYERMLGWYADPIQYNRIGFLIAQASGDSRAGMLRQIAGAAATLRHSKFGDWLRTEVVTELHVASSELATLRYDTDRPRIQRMLLLMNVETSSRHAKTRYPFAAHHADTWELEHIHAQNAPDLNRVWQWRAWVDAHEAAVLALPEGPKRGPLLERITQWRKASESEAAVGDAFRELARAILGFLSSGDAANSEDEVHGLGNLALLSKADNIRFGNSAFEVKRQKAIVRDREGGFVPPCTHHVFLKYYSGPGTVQPHFWSAQDRKDYLDEIRTILCDYLGREVQP